MFTPKTVFQQTQIIEPREDVTHAEVAAGMLRRLLTLYPEWQTMRAEMRLEERRDGTAEVRILIIDPHPVDKWILLWTMVVVILIAVVMYPLFS